MESRWPGARRDAYAWPESLCARGTSPRAFPGPIRTAIARPVRHGPLFLEDCMTRLNEVQMHAVQGGDPGTVCGALVGATVMAMFVNPLAAALIYMVTPAGCALDFALSK